MNIVFSLILIGGVAALTIVSPEKVMPVMLKGAENSASFALKLFIIYAVWMSVLKILEKSGADKSIAKALSPATKKLFKNESEDAYRYINLNLAANILGMGGAATPAGLKSMENIRSKKNRILLVVINSASVQLVPTTILAMRAGLDAAADIMLPSLIVNVLTTVIAVIMVKVFVK